MRKSNARLLLAALVMASAAIGGACNCGARLAVNGDTTVQITAPDDGASYLVSDSVVVVAEADNAAGLVSLALEIGSEQFLLCNALTTGATHIDCNNGSSPQSFIPSAYASQTVGGKMVITAVATASSGTAASVSITLTITQPIPPPPPDAGHDAGPPPFDAGPPPPDAGPAVWSLVFVQPMPSNGFPPAATVSAPSLLEMGIVGTPGGTIKSIVVTDEKSDTLGDFTTTPYQKTVTWLTEPGVGAHSLTGIATDSTGATRSAALVLTVNPGSCTSDSSCTGGQRCCLDDGMCHAPVGEYADCDCANPCPTTQGCLAGTCGQLPQQCRPGCNPGNDNTPADVCAPINGVQAYCEPLPPSQVTVQNKGGACAPGDGCSVTAQNCPDAPLFPGSDAGPPANPIVSWTCEPAGMNGNNEATVCYPAGTWPQQTNNTNNKCLGEDESCGTSSGCQKGYECDGIEGDPGAGLACSQQCGTPYNGGIFGGCPPNKYGGCPDGQFCDSLVGNGMVTFTTGSCFPLSLIGCP